MTYWGLNAIFLAVVAVVLLLAVVLRRRGLRWAAIGVTAVVLIVATAVFDNVMIRVGLVGYDRAKISGAFVGVAPLEDFAYTIAAIILLPSLWALLSPRVPRVPRAVRSNEGEAQR